MKKMLFLLAFVALSLTTWAQSSDFQEGQFYYSINRDRPSEVSVAYNYDYSSITGELIIPSTVTHGEYTYTVTGINQLAFSNCSEITSVSIPSSMITIGWETFIGTAFYNDPSNWVDNALYVDNCLIAVKPELAGACEIAEGTRVIGEGAFYKCSSLTSVTIPSSVISIGYGAFIDCSSLSSVSIPSSVKYVGGNVFDGTALYNDASNWVDNVLYVDNCLINAKRDLSGAYNIAEGTRIIAEQAFSYTSLTSVTVPSSVVNIGPRAFYSIDNLTDIQVESGNTAYLSENGILHNADKTVLLCYPEGKKDRTLTIPASLRCFGYDAFDNNSYLNTIEWNAVNFLDFTSIYDSPEWRYVSTLVIGEGVEHIPAYLCNNFSSSLYSLTIPSTVTSVGQDAFAGCGNLTVYKNYSQLRLPDFLITSSPNLKELVSPIESFFLLSLEDLSSITGLKSLTVHSLEKFENRMYDRVLSFTNLQQNTLTYIDIESLRPYDDIYIPDKCFLDFTLLGTAKLPNKLESIGYRAFENCRVLQEFTIPASVNEIGESAFENCRMLQEFTIPASVTEIDDSAFDNCRSLSAVHFGGSTEEQADDPAASQCALQRIGNWAFYNCHQLQELNIPEGVTEIGNAAFYGCSYLEDLVLPSSLQTIGDNCFSLCSKLGCIIVNAAIPPVIEAKTFYEVDRSIPVYVPKGSLEAYKADTYWSEFRLLDDDPATVISPEADNSGCYAANGIIYNPNGVSLNVYNLQGVLIYTGNATKIEMPAKGIYILMTPTTTEKVVL